MNNTNSLILIFMMASFTYLVFHSIHHHENNLFSNCIFILTCTGAMYLAYFEIWKKLTDKGIDD